MTIFLGLDLAWTPGRESGICVLEDNGCGPRLLALGTAVLEPREFAALIASFGADVVAAIDAPLVVTPERRAERDLARSYGRFHASAYTATLAFLEKMNGLAGPRLAGELAALEFSLDPAALTRRARGRYALEVFPHAAHVAFFALERIFPYKRGRLASRRSALDLYRAHLAVECSPLEPHPSLEAWMQTLLDSLPGRALKQVEDALDALTCALVAYHCWDRGPDGFDVFGCGDCGHIVVPRPATSVPAPTSP